MTECNRPSPFSPMVMQEAATGIHPAYATTYKRRLRLSADSPLIPILREAGVEVVADEDGNPAH